MTPAQPGESPKSPTEALIELKARDYLPLNILHTGGEFWVSKVDYDAAVAIVRHHQADESVQVEHTPRWIIDDLPEDAVVLNEYLLEMILAEIKNIGLFTPSLVASHAISHYIELATDNIGRVRWITGRNDIGVVPEREALTPSPKDLEVLLCDVANTIQECEHPHAHEKASALWRRFELRRRGSDA